MFTRIHPCLLPFPDHLWLENGEVHAVKASTGQKIQYYAANFFRLIGEVALLPFRMAYSLASRCLSVFRKAPENKKIEIPSEMWVPERHGCADSLFQTSGLGTRASATPLEGISTWEKWLSPERIEGTEDGDYERFFTDVLGDPAPYVNILKEMGCTSQRVSLEMSVIMPEPGKINKEAVRLYQGLFQEMIQAGIEPCVTLHHFVHPQWFEDRGGFEKLENVELFVNYCLQMMETFPEVSHWMPFNEFGVYGMQSFVRGVYPPGKTYDVAAAGRVIRNMLIAHCKLYERAKERFGDQVQIGSSHQWINFLPKTGNPLERDLCTILSIYHKAVYGFLKDGHFAMQLGGKANVQLTIPKEEFEKHNKYFDFIGGQFYGFPRVKAGWNGFKAHPGYKTVNFGPFSFGSTCDEGGKMMSFGPSVAPEDFELFLQDIEALGKPYIISENGCDARIQAFGEKEWKIDNETQRDYYAKIFSILSRHKELCKGYFGWTMMRGHLEWDRGHFPQLGVVEIQKDAHRRISRYRFTPAAWLIQEVYQRANKNLRENRSVA